jgi:pimeloyl-ACP methyl ester carboxylesterase
MRTRLLAALALALVASTATATAGAADRPPRISWAACPAGSAPTVQCGTIEVPVDWAHRDGPQTTVAFSRRPADDRAHPLGVLFFNPGGPGDPSSRYVRAADTYFSPALRARFDIVGVDPRGTGGSGQVRCAEPILTAGTVLWPRTKAQFDALLRHNRAVGRSCVAGTGPLIGHLDTMSVARDHDAVRAALGAGTVSWLGVSYGSTLAANYADLFGRHVRAMVLDAGLEHSQPEIVQVSDEAMAAEDSFNRFVTWCATAADCALRGRDVAGDFDRLVAGADAHPIPVEGAERPVLGEDIRMGVKGLLRLKVPAAIAPDLSWAGLSQLLAAAMAGDASAFALPPPEFTQPDAQALLGIACMEYVPQVRTWADMRQRIELGRAVAPHLQGASETWQVLLCGGWPVPVANPPRALDVRGVPALLVHAVHDPSDAYRWSHGLLTQIHGADLLTRTGDGHTSYWSSPCARAATDAYLISPHAPASAVCDD